MRHFGLLGLILLSGALQAVAFTANPGVAIPDNNGNGVSSNINIPATGDRIYSLRVGVRITHTYDADLNIWLLPPGVTWAGPYATIDNGAVVTPAAGVIELSTKNGGANDNYGSGTGGATVYANFTSSTDPLAASTAAITGGTSPFTGQPRYTPEGLANWNVLFGGNPSGNWTLVVCDGWGADLGTLNSWQIDYQPVPAGVLSVGRGSSNAPGVTLRTGSTNQVAGQLELAAGSATTVMSVALAAENGVNLNGSFSRVALHDDLNGNGVLDAGENTVFSGTVAASANITLTASPAVAMGAGTSRSYLVVVDTLSSPAALGVALRVTAAASVVSTGTEFGSFPLVFGYHHFGPVHSYGSAPVGGRAVQDNYGPGVTDTIIVPATLDRIGSLRVGIRVSHTALQDVDVYLIPPGVTWAGPYIVASPPAGVIALTQDEGANGDHYGTGAANGPYVYTYFSPNTDPVNPGTTQVTAGGQNAPFTSVAVYRPIGEAAMAALYGTDPSGAWTLVVVDDSNNTAGTLNSWYVEYRARQRASLTGTAAFGSANIGTLAAGSPHTFTVSNPGEFALSVTAITVAGANAADFALSALPGLPANIPAGGTVNFGVSFTPSAIGARAANLNVTSNSNGVAGSISTLALTGTGVAGVLSTTSPVDYGSTNLGVPSTAVSHTINNTGTGTLTITAVVFTGGNLTDWAFDPAPVLPIVIPPSGSAQVYARFTPGGFGPRSSILRLTSDSGGTPSSLFNVTVNGTGVAGVLSTASPVDYGTTNILAPSPLSPLAHTINNTGNGVLTITALAFIGPNAADWGFSPAPTLPIVIPASGSFVVNGRFVPLATGARTATLRITSDSGGALGNFDVTLTGAATVGTISMVAPVDYGASFTGQPSSLSVRTHTIQNIGTGPLTVTAAGFVGANAGDWVFTPAPGLPMVIPAGLSAQLFATLTPTALGSRGATLRIVSDSGGVSGNHDVTVTGQGLAPYTVSGVTVSADGGGPQTVQASVSGTPSTLVDVVVTHSGGAAAGVPVLVSAESGTILGNTILGVPANSILRFVWDAYATQRHVTAANYVLTLTPYQGAFEGLAGSSAALTLQRDGGWASHLAPTQQPTSVYGHCAVYDTAHDRMVVFAGHRAWDPTNHVWVYQRGAGGDIGWRRITPAGPQPTPREGAGAVYDAVNLRMIVFGGQSWAGALSDTWALSLNPGTETWTQIAQGSAATPSARSFFAFEMDAAGQRVLLHGGLSGSMICADTWALDISNQGTENWGTSAIAATGPACFGMAAAVDSVGGRLVVYGGQEAAAVSSQVWQMSLAGSSWSLVSSGGLAGARLHSTYLHDTANNQLIVAAGYSGSAHLSSAFALALQGPLQDQWTALAADPGAPISRLRGSTAYDAARQQGLFFGGYDSNAAMSSLSFLDLSGAPVWSMGATPPPSSPQARWGASSVFDSVSNRVVLFGGRGGSSIFNDVWVLDRSVPNAAWQQLNVTGAKPSTRFNQAAAFDAVNRRMIIMGGTAGPNTPLGDLWTLDLSGAGPATWTQHPGTGPVARRRHSLVYDSLLDRAVIFGGIDEWFAYADTWAYSFGAASWTPIVPAGALPAARSGHGAMFDPVLNRMVIFCGTTVFSGFNDVWALDLGASVWTDISQVGGTLPAQRANFGFGANAAGTMAWLFSGAPDFWEIAVGQTWHLDVSGATAVWTPLAVPAGPPSPRSHNWGCLDGTYFITGHGMTGGALNTVVVADVWQLDTTAPATGYVQAGLGNTPAGLAFAATAYDPVNRRMIAFGGVAEGEASGQTYSLDLAAPIASWKRLTATGPTPRRQGTLVYDPASQRMVLFGGRSGQSDSSALNDTWALSLGLGTEQWVQLAVTGTAPTARYGHVAVVDNAGRMIVFSGRQANGFDTNDVHALDLSTLGWSPIAAGAPPLPRVSAAAIYDPVGNRMIVFGGLWNGVMDAFDALSLSGSPQWTSLPHTGSAPGPLVYHSMIYDSIGHRALVFGGFGSGGMQDRLFAFNLTGATWTEILPLVAKPPHRSGHCATWDSVAQRMVIAGGLTDGDTPLADSLGQADVWFWGE